MKKMTEKSSDDTRIAVISNDIRYIKENLVEIKDSLKGLGSIFASREQLNQIAKETEIRLCALEKAAGWTKYLAPIASSIFCSILTFLLIEFLKK